VNRPPALCLAAFATVVAVAACAHSTPPEATDSGSARPASAQQNWTCRDGEKPLGKLTFATGQRDGIVADDQNDVAGGPLFGDPEDATRYWAAQHGNDCGLMASRLVIAEATGNAPTEAEMIAAAGALPSECTPGDRIYTGTGTCTEDLVHVLKHFGVDTVRTNVDIAAAGGPRTGMKALKEYLRDGRYAMVCIDADVIWEGKPAEEGCSHEVTVAAIDVDSEIVYLGDSGSEETQGETTSLETFEVAWRSGNYDLIVTGPRS
jgi:hypothetical protein